MNADWTPPVVSIETCQQFTTRKVLLALAELKPEEIYQFIVALEEEAGDWDLSNGLYDYFVLQKKKYEEAYPPDVRDLPPGRRALSDLYGDMRDAGIPEDQCVPDDPDAALAWVIGKLPAIELSSEEVVLENRVARDIALSKPRSDQGAPMTSPDGADHEAMEMMRKAFTCAVCGGARGLAAQFHDGGGCVCANSIEVSIGNRTATLTYFTWDQLHAAVLDERKRCAAIVREAKKPGYIRVLEGVALRILGLAE